MVFLVTDVSLLWLILTFKTSSHLYQTFIDLSNSCLIVKHPMSSAWVGQFLEFFSFIWIFIINTLIVIKTTIKVVEGFEVQKGGSGYEWIRYLVDATQVLDFNHESVKESPCRQELFMLMKSGYWSTKHLRDSNPLITDSDYSVVKITSS